MQRNALTTLLFTSAVRAAGAAGLLALVTAGAALADDKPDPAARSDKPVFLDPAWNVIHIGTSSESYTLYGNFRFAGAMRDQDRARLDVRAGKKLVAQIDCSHGEGHHDVNGKFRWVSCEKTGLTATGAFDIDVIYIDDLAEKEYVAASLKATIKGLKSGGTLGWALTPDDLPALVFAYPERDQSLSFYYWSTNDPASHDQASMRCKVGEDKFDVRADMGSYTDITSGINTGREKDDKFFEYHHVYVQARLMLGKRPEGNTETERAWLGDRPGKYSCQVRMNGKVYRELMFEADAEGRLLPNPMQSGARPLRLMPEEYLIDSRIPATNLEKRLRPDALKKSAGYGMPWPDGPGVKEAQAAFPAAVGKD